MFVGCVCALRATRLFSFRWQRRRQFASGALFRDFFEFDPCSDGFKVMDSVTVGGGDIKGSLGCSSRNIYELGDKSKLLGDVVGTPFPLWTQSLGNSNGSLFGFGLDQGVSLQHLPSLLLGNSTLLGHTQAGATLQSAGPERATSCLTTGRTHELAPPEALVCGSSSSVSRARNILEKTQCVSDKPSGTKHPVDHSPSLEHSIGLSQMQRNETKRPRLTGFQNAEKDRQNPVCSRALITKGTDDETEKAGKTPMNVGVWSDAEMELFYAALRKVGRDFHAVARVVGTRSASQVTGVFHRCLRRAIDPVKRAAIVRPDINAAAEAMHLFDRVLHPDLQIRILFAARELETGTGDHKIPNGSTRSHVCVVAGRCISLPEAIEWSAALLAMLERSDMNRKQSECNLESASKRPADFLAASRSHPESRCDASPGASRERVSTRPLATPQADADARAAVLRKKEISLQIVPIPGSLEELELQRFHKNPRILLTLRPNKKIAAVFDYLAEKWGPCILASFHGLQDQPQPSSPGHALRLRVCTDPAYQTGVTELDHLWDAAACRRAQANGLARWLNRSDDGDALLVKDIYRLCGSPSHIRLQYAWVGISNDSCSTTARRLSNLTARELVSERSPYPPDSRPADATSTVISTDSLVAKSHFVEEAQTESGGRSDRDINAPRSSNEQSIIQNDQRKPPGLGLEYAQCSTDSLLQSLLYGVHTANSMHGSAQNNSNAIHRAIGSPSDAIMISGEKDLETRNRLVANQLAHALGPGDSSSSWIFSLVPMGTTESKP